LQLWASLHGLGDGWQLADAATAAYRGETKSDAVLRARLFLDAIRNRAQITPARTDQPTGKPELLTVQQAAKRLQISTRTLWTLTKQRIIPYVPGGRSPFGGGAARTSWQQYRRPLQFSGFVARAFRCGSVDEEKSIARHLNRTWSQVPCLLHANCSPEAGDETTTWEADSRATMRRNGAKHCGIT
jgi:hypothetical protein